MQQHIVLENKRFSFLQVSLMYFKLKLLKGVVHLKKKTFADNLLTPMSSKISM